MIGGSGKPVEAAAPGTDVTHWRRLSVLMLLVHPVQEIVRGLPALVPFAIAGASAGSPWPVLAGVAIAVGLGAARWFTTSFRVTEAQVQLRHGLFNRRTIAVPLDRVRTVDVEANVLHRVLGLVRLRVGTGHADTKRSKDLTLDGLTLPEGTRLRDELLHDQRRWAPPVPVSAQATQWAGPLSELPQWGSPESDAQALTVGAPAPGAFDAPSAMIARLDPRWIRYGPFSLTGLITVVAGAGLVWRVVNETQFDPARAGVVRSGRDALQGLPTWAIAVVSVLAAATVIAALSTVRYVLAYWNFTLVHTGARTFHTSRGLLTTRATTLEERRVRGVALTEPLLLRSVGGAQVSAVATGLRTGRGADIAGGALLSPPAPRRVALGICRAVLNSAEASEVDLVPHGAAARRRRYVRAVLPGVVLLVVIAVLEWTALAVPPWVLLLPVLVLLAGVGLAYDRYRSLGHAAAGGFVVTGEGSVVRRRVALAQDAVIGWNLRATFFQRRVGLMTLTATTACGAKHYRILDVTEAEGEQFADRVTPGILTPFMT